jgi:hypothetical protein
VTEPNAVSNAIGYAEHRSRSDRAVIRVYDAIGNVIEMHEHKGDFKEWSQKGSKWSVSRARPRRNSLSGFSVSSKRKPQVTKRYRTP